MVVGMKTCVDCQETKPLSEYDINNHQRGYRLSYCKACRRLRRAESRAKRGVTARKQYADTDTIKWCRSCEQPISRVEFGAATYCKACMAKRTRAYRQQHPDKVKESYKRWAEAKGSEYFRIRENERRWRAGGRKHVQPWDDNGRVCAQCGKYQTYAHYHKSSSQKSGYSSYCRECTAERTAAYLARESTADVKRAWWQSNSDRVAIYGHARRVRVTYKVTVRDLRRLMTRQSGRCTLCDDDLAKVQAHLDHIVPLSKGGTHGIGNLQYLCQPCNSRKYNRFMIYLRR